MRPVGGNEKFDRDREAREAEILRIARRNKWTLAYLSIVTTALLVLMVLESSGKVAL